MTLSVSAEDKSLLEELAIEHGCKWGKKPNITLLMERIARREITIGKPTLQAKLIKALGLVEKALETALEAVRQVRSVD